MISTTSATGATVNGAIDPRRRDPSHSTPVSVPAPGVAEGVGENAWMHYDLSGLGTHEFENMVQALAVCVLGDGVCSARGQTVAARPPSTAR